MIAAVYIITDESSEDCLKEVTAGIEEESVKYVVLQNSGGALFKAEEFDEAKALRDVEALAEAAAESSPFSCGIGIKSNTAALALKSTCITVGTEEASWRTVGHNAGRLVKKEKLIF